MSWLPIISGIISLLKWLLGREDVQAAMRAGQDAEISRQLQEVLRKTERGRAILQYVGSLSDSELDSKLRELEPPETTSK